MIIDLRVTSRRGDGSASPLLLLSGQLFSRQLPEHAEQNQSMGGGRQVRRDACECRGSFSVTTRGTRGELVRFCAAEIAAGREICERETMRLLI